MCNLLPLHSLFIKGDPFILKLNTKMYYLKLKTLFINEVQMLKLVMKPDISRDDIKFSKPFCKSVGSILQITR